MAQNMVLEEHPLCERRVSEVLPFFDLYLRCRRKCCGIGVDDEEVDEEFRPLIIKSPKSSNPSGSDLSKIKCDFNQKNSELSFSAPSLSGSQHRPSNGFKFSIEQWTQSKSEVTFDETLKKLSDLPDIPDSGTTQAKRENVKR